MKILEKEFEFDFLDADIMEKLENISESAKQKIEELSKENKKPSQTIREMCHIIMECFNELFGEGTDKEIFGEKTNFGLCLKAFEELLAEKQKQSYIFEKSISKYSVDRIKK